MPVKSLTDIKPNKANPRRIKKDRQEKLSEYLNEYGDLSGVVYNANPECEAIVSGHQRTAEFKRQKSKLTILERYDPAQGDGTTARGFIETPSGQRYLYREVNWPKEKADAATIIANGQFGEWDSDILANQWDFDVPEFREFGVPEFVFGGDGMDGEGGILNNALNSEAKEDDFEAPAIEEVVTDIKLGDLFEIGPHRLLCGDSTSKEDVARLMCGELSNLYITDPPYGVKYSEKNAFLNAISRGNCIQKPIENDGLSVSDSAELWFNSFSCMCDFMGNKSSYYIFSALGGDLMMMMMMIDKVFLLKHCLIWVKNNHVLGRSDYNYKHEPILFGWKKKGTHDFYGGFQTSVIDFAKPQKSDLHPTMKPVGLISILVKNSSKELDIITDSFLGSGTTMVAAHQLNRKCYGMEIDPKYCQVIVNRMARLDTSLEIKRNGEPYNPK